MPTKKKAAKKKAATKKKAAKKKAATKKKAAGTKRKGPGAGAGEISAKKVPNNSRELWASDEEVAAGTAGRAIECAPNESE